MLRVGSVDSLGLLASLNYFVSLKDGYAQNVSTFFKACLSLKQNVISDG